jgi:hypothetical protein
MVTWYLKVMIQAAVVLLENYGGGMGNGSVDKLEWTN